jgi:CheY-like chemotaxis protein
MTELIRRLLVFGRSGRTTLSPVSLRKAVEDVQVILEHTLSKQVELKVELCDEPCNTFATTSGLQQILLNLCLNAADAMAYGGELSIRVHRLEPDDGFRLTHGALTRDAYYVIEAHDTGCGIPTEVRERIFEPFFTTKELSSRKGTGLGLAVVWQLVREFHGLVSVYSEVGEGTTFRVYLPRYSDEEEGESEEAHSSSIPRGSEAILVVDDEPAVLDVTVRILQHLGYAVYCAEDGPSAVRTLEELQGEIDCAIVDLSMPRMGGVECAERLREIQPGIRVIFASGHNMADQEEELRARGADAIVQKPMQLTDLARRMRSVLGE